MEFTSMVIGNFNLLGITLSPDKANAPLIVDTDAPLTLATPFQRFQMVGGREAKIFQNDRGIQGVESKKCAFLNILRQFQGVSPEKYFLRFAAFE
jgi:hypothetical protein